MKLSNTKKSILSFCLVYNFIVFRTFAQPAQLDPYEYNDMILEIKSVGSPYVTDGYAIFTLQNKWSSIGIAFDFEDYKTVHPFNIRTLRDAEDNITYSCKFFALHLPQGLLQIKYRVVLDGLWTCDPQNSAIMYDTDTQLLVSYLDIPKDASYATQIIKQQDSQNFTHIDNGSKTIRFVYQGPPNQKIRIGGNFTNWDSWIYTMQETTPGKYCLDLSLGAGTYYYKYYKGVDAFIDTTNPHKGYTTDGKTVSIITVQ